MSNYIYYHKTQYKHCEFPVWVLVLEGIGVGSAKDRKRRVSVLWWNLWTSSPEKCEYTHTNKSFSKLYLKL